MADKLRVTKDPNHDLIEHNGLTYIVWWFGVAYTSVHPNIEGIHSEADAKKLLDQLKADFKHNNENNPKKK